MNYLDQFLEKRKWLLALSLLFIFGLGLAVRFYDLQDPPMDFHPTRQFHSILMARGMYYQDLDDIPEWKRELAVQQWKSEGLIEPPFMEWLTAQTYKVTGQEAIWYARIYSILFWTAGGVGLFMLAKELAGNTAGLFAAAYFMLLKYGAIASRSFQPDPLMTALIVLALWALVRWSKTSNWKWSIAAGLLAGLAILCKSVAVFFVGIPFLVVVLINQGLLKALRNPKVWVMGVLAVLPYAMFHVYGIYISGLLREQFSLRFFPQLWVNPVFYLQWKGLIASTVGFEWFILAILGILLLRERASRGLLLALFAGYFLYGFTFAYHISTHDYYQLPLIPLVGLGLAGGVDSLVRGIQAKKWLAYPVLAGVLLVVVVTSAWDVRVALKRDDFRNEPIFWTRISEKVGENASVVALAQNYSYPLQYWGWMRVTNWMTAGDFNYRKLAGVEFNVRNLFDEETAGKDYFVVTLLDELNNQPEVKQLLDENYPILEQSSDYIIYDLREKK
jgi:4-amino-4-deoxy-L-arabinose transferase-like glycosyltransferase